MNNILSTVLLLGLFIAPLMYLTLKLTEAVAKLNLNDFFLLSIF